MAKPRNLLSVALAAASLLCVCTLVHAKHGSHWTIGDIGDPPADATPCPHLSKEVLSAHASNNLVLMTVTDKLTMGKFGKSWVENVKEAGISYAFVAALDPWTSKMLGHWKFPCFNAPMDKLAYQGTGVPLHSMYGMTVHAGWCPWIA